LCTVRGATSHSRVARLVQSLPRRLAGVDVAGPQGRVADPCGHKGPKIRRRGTASLSSADSTAVHDRVPHILDVRRVAGDGARTEILAIGELDIQTSEDLVQPWEHGDKELLHGGLDGYEHHMGSVGEDVVRMDEIEGLLRSDHSFLLDALYARP